LCAVRLRSQSKPHIETAIRNAIPDIGEIAVAEIIELVEAEEAPSQSEVPEELPEPIAPGGEQNIQLVVAWAREAYSFGSGRRGKRIATLGASGILLLIHADA
jgi:hypothetical protein